MESTNMIWGVIVGYILFACAISMITSLWIRYHLKRAVMYPHCLLSVDLLPSLNRGDSYS